jgi:hypothetical protein
MFDARRVIVASSFTLAMIACMETALSACITPREREAYEVYALRTQVLVGAQSCRMTDRFNIFAMKFSRELTSEGRELRAHYLKAYGKGGDKALDDFVTQIANASFVEGSGGGDLCSATTAIFDDVMALPEGKLATYSSQHKSRALPVMDFCTTTKVAATKKQ